MQTMRQYHLAALGGTFDHLHAGHLQLLQTALATADNLVIGITDELMVEDKSFSQLIEPFSKRKLCLEKQLLKWSVTNRVSLIHLTEPFGPALTDSSIDCLVVSQQTKTGGQQLNRMRQQQSLKPLPLIIAQMVYDQSGTYLSSTRIRQGIVSREGIVYPLVFKHNIKFSSRQLSQLSKPQGKLVTPQNLIKTLSPLKPIHLIGDEVTKFFLSHQLPFSTAIIDAKTRRGPTPFSLKSTIVLNNSNPASTINSKIAKSILSIYQSPQNQTIIQITGEEDLLAFIPCLSQPLNSLVFYGQPQAGIVMIPTTERNKRKFYRIIQTAIKGV